MAKYICVKSLTKDVPVGTELVGKFHSPGRFILTEDSKLKCISGIGPRWYKDDNLPLVGALWVWQRQDHVEALNKFEEAVRQQEQYQSDIHHYGESDIDISDETVDSKYQKTKAELLTRLSYIP